MTTTDPRPAREAAVSAVRHLHVVADEPAPTVERPPAPKGRDPWPRWYDPCIPLTVWVCVAIICTCVFGALVTLRSWG